jgi:hypothetical protein
MQSITTIQLQKKTRERLLEIGMKKETYDDLINRLIDFYLRFKERGIDEDIKKEGRGTNPQTY